MKSPRGGVEGMIELGILVPHPPIMVSEVGRDEIRHVEATRKAVKAAAERLQQAKPETVVLISPHAPLFADAVAMLGDETLGGDLGRFGAAGVQVSFRNDLELARAIAREAESGEVPAVVLSADRLRRFGISPGLDHGTVVPLSFLKPAIGDAGLVVMGYAVQPYEDLYAFGCALRRAVESVGRKAAIVASGDLSHRLSPDGSAGYDPRGREFDERLTELIRRADVQGIMDLDPVLVEKAGECGLRSLIIMLGAMDGRRLTADLLSYEGPFGVGYAVAVFEPGADEPQRSMLAALLKQRQDRVLERRRRESPLVALARAVVEAHVKGEPLPPVPANFPAHAQRPAGVFVSIKKHGQLRGCIGTVEPTTASVAEEIRQNAVSAASRDPRFEPIGRDELPGLTYSVDVLGGAEPVKGLADLDPHIYGVIVRRGARSGLLLPDLEGIETPEEQVAIARRKAGIGPDEPVNLYRFKVERFT